MQILRVSLTNSNGANRCMLSSHSKSYTWLIIHSIRIHTHSMEGYQTDIQALLRDINGNYQDPQHDKSPQPPRPPTRPISCSFSSQAEHSMAPNSSLAPISEQQLLYDVQASRLLDANTYSTLNNNDLDPYGSCLKTRNRKRTR